MTGVCDDQDRGAPFPFLAVLNHHANRCLNNRVLELIPLARLVLADLEASVAGSLEEPALEEEEEGEEERSGPMDVDDGGGDKKEEAAAEATTAAAEPAMAEGPVVIVVGSHTQEEDDSPALSSSSSNNLPHPRVPTRWDGEEYRRVAAWVSALPLPAFLDEGDMDRAWLRKAFGKLQVRLHTCIVVREITCFRR